MAEDAVSVHRLPSGVALELTSLACVTPSICSNVAVTYLDRVHASDASNQKIAAAQSCMSHSGLRLIREGPTPIWAMTFNRGLLRQIESNDDDLEAAGPAAVIEPLSKPPLMYFDFVETCGRAGKVPSAIWVTLLPRFGLIPQST